MANFRGKIQTDLGLSKFSQYRPVGRVRADTSAKPVLDASARTFEALGNLSPTLMKLAAYQVGLQKEEIRSEEQKRFASASLEERRRFAEGEALEEEKQNPTFAGSNPWRRVIRQEIAGQHAAEVNLLSELERRRDSLTDHDRSIEDIKSEMQSLQAQYRPDSLYGGRAYDASAAAVVQQNEGRFLAIRGRKQEAATIEAITTGIQDQFVLAVESGSVDFGAIRGLLDRYHSLTGKSGKEFLHQARESVAGIYDQRHKAGSISLEDLEEAFTVIYSVETSMPDPSANAQVSSPDTGGMLAYKRDEETGELVPPKLRVQAIESSGKTHFVVIPEDMSKEDFEDAVRGGAVYESFLTFVSEEAAQAIVANPEKYIRPDGTQRKQAPAISSHDDLQRSVAEDNRRQAARDYDSAESLRNLQVAEQRINAEVRPWLAKAVAEGMDEREILEELRKRFAKIGEETQHEGLVDADDEYEKVLVRRMIAEEVRSQGHSFHLQREEIIKAIMEGNFPEDDVWLSPFLTAKDKQMLSLLASDPSGTKARLFNESSPSDEQIDAAVAASDLARQSEATDQRYLQRLRADVKARFVDMVMTLVPEDENNPEGWSRALTRIDVPEVTQSIVNTIVASDVRTPSAGKDATDLFLDPRVKVRLTTAFSDQVSYDRDVISRVDRWFNESMEAYATAWRKDNPDGHFGKMVEDFLSDGPEGFKEFFNERMDRPFELDEDSKLDDDSEALMDAMVEDVAPGLDEFSAAVSKTGIKNQREAKDRNYLVALKAQFLEGLGELAIENISNRGEELTPKALDAELDRLVEMENMVPILETLVAGDVAEPDPGLDVNRLTGDARVALHLRTAFKDEGVWVDGKLVDMPPDFNDSMVDWVTEYRKDNPDASFDKMVRDFISVGEDSPGFKPFYKKAAEVDAVPEQAPLTPRQQSLAGERIEASLEAEEEALADFPGWVFPEPPSKSRVNFMLEAREAITALRQELGTISGWEESDEYNKDSTVKKYRKGKKAHEKMQLEKYDVRNRSTPTTYTGRGLKHQDRNAAGTWAMTDKVFKAMLEKGELSRTFYGKYILRDTLRYRMEGGLIDGKPSHITLEELKSGELRIPHRKILVPVPKAELNPREYLMVADKEQLDSYTSEDWMTLYGNLDDTVKATLDRYVEAGAAADIPELLKGLQEDLLYLHYRIDLEK